MYSYGDDDLNRTEGPDEKESGDEESRESNSVSISLQKPLLIGFFPSSTAVASSEKVCCLRKLKPDICFSDVLSIHILGKFCGFTNSLLHQCLILLKEKLLKCWHLGSLSMREKKVICSMF